MIALAIFLWILKNLIWPGEIAVRAGIFSSLGPAVAAAHHLILGAAGAEEFRMSLVIDNFFLAGNTGYVGHDVLRTVCYL